MLAVFYFSAVVAILATLGVLLVTRPVHALLYLIVSLLAVAIVFYTLGAPFAAALEVIIYAGAIMILFVFVIMMLNLGAELPRRERAWLTPRAWVGPGILAALLLAELVGLASAGRLPAARAPVDSHAVGTALFGPYLLGVELASLLLLAALVGAYHLARRAGEPP